MSKVVAAQKHESATGKIIAAHQPNFMPNLAFFYKMSRADEFVIIGNLQFERQEGWQRRNLFQNGPGDMWLTVPLLGSQNQLLKDVKIKYERDWIKKHRKSLLINYNNSSEKEYLDEILDIYDKKYENLIDLNVALIKSIKNALGIETPFLFVDKEVSGEKHKMIINVCEKYKSGVYLSGNGAHYLTEERLEEITAAGIKNKFLGESPVPPTKFPYSALHYILKDGKEATAELLKMPLVVSRSV